MQLYSILSSSSIHFPSFPLVIADLEEVLEREKGASKRKGA
jgi:hypothetical protein